MPPLNGSFEISSTFRRFYVYFCKWSAGSFSAADPGENVTSVTGLGQFFVWVSRFSQLCLDSKPLKPTQWTGEPVGRTEEVQGLGFLQEATGSAGQQG